MCQTWPLHGPAPAISSSVSIDPADVSTELEELHFKRQREGLTANEAERAAELVRQYDRKMLLRAEAALLLKERGHDVSEVAAPA